MLFIILVFCVVCFVFVCGRSGGWVSVLLVILVFCVVCFDFVCGGPVLLVILVFLCCVFCFCLWEIGRVGVRVACFLFVRGGLGCLTF